MIVVGICLLLLAGARGRTPATYIRMLYLYNIFIFYFISKEDESFLLKVLA